MKNHQYVNGQLLQTNKSFNQLKMSQKEMIYEYCLEAYIVGTRKGFKNKELDEYVLQTVQEKIEERGIWLPSRELNQFYNQKKNRFQKRVANF